MDSKAEVRNTKKMKAFKEYKTSNNANSPTRGNIIITPILEKARVSKRQK